mmetsp:Transcript_3762/g.10821  ORF Transcript_3762/g.10821 Transcript_3762/m.10821 type:complete len:390 (+) Transcript_3762:179-1348(+)
MWVRSPAPVAPRATKRQPGRRRRSRHQRRPRRRRGVPLALSPLARLLPLHVGHDAVHHALAQRRRQALHPGLQPLPHSSHEASPGARRRRGGARPRNRRPRLRGQAQRALRRAVPVLGERPAHAQARGDALDEHRGAAHEHELLGEGLELLDGAVWAQLARVVAAREGLHLAVEEPDGDGSGALRLGVRLEADAELKRELADAVQIGTVHLVALAPGLRERRDDLGERYAPIVADPLHLAKVDEPDAAVLHHEDISRVRVAVEEPRLQNGPPERVRQRAQQPTRKDLGLGAIRVDAALLHLLLRAAQRHALEQVHDEHALAHEAVDGLGHRQRRLARPAAGRAHERLADLRHGRGLAHEVELLLELALELAEDDVVVDGNLVEAPQLFA